MDLTDIHALIVWCVNYRPRVWQATATRVVRPACGGTSADWSLGNGDATWTANPPERHNAMYRSSDQVVVIASSPAGTMGSQSFR